MKPNLPYYGRDTTVLTTEYMLGNDANQLSLGGYSATHLLRRISRSQPTRHETARDHRSPAGYFPRQLRAGGGSLTTDVAALVTSLPPGWEIPRRVRARATRRTCLHCVRYPPPHEPSAITNLSTRRGELHSPYLISFAIIAARNFNGWQTEGLRNAISNMQQKQIDTLALS